jgi:hypothetical protein
LPVLAGGAMRIGETGTETSRPLDPADRITLGGLVVIDDFTPMAGRLAAGA